MKRRDVLASMGALLGCTLIPIGNGAARAGSGAKKFVFVILRGGMDGLAAVPAVGDPAYEQARGPIALDPAKLLSLDTTFGLHPAFGAIHPMFAAGELAFVHAVGLPYLKRSHFDAQDLLETGGTRPGRLHTGWLNRAMLTMGEGEALALGKTVPLVLRGRFKASTIDPLRSKDAKLNLVELMEDMFASDPLLATALTQGLASREQVRMAQMDVSLEGKPKGRQKFKKSLAILGRLLAEEQGSQVAVIELGGWDTHANQGGITGSLSAGFERLSKGLLELKMALGDTWKETVVVVASEFGRTVSGNGTGGTDHGTGGLGMVLGGSVAGGVVHGDWPGLAHKQLYEGRDLRRTTDIRSVFKSILRDHMHLSGRSLDRDVFPDSQQVPVLEGLIRRS